MTNIRSHREHSLMKKIVTIIVNVIIIAAMLIFVVLYSRFENTDSYRRQIEHFESTMVTMEKVTENYLEGEQQICDVWAHYINSEHMTMEEAVALSVPPMCLRTPRHI